MVRYYPPLRRVWLLPTLLPLTILVPVARKSDHRWIAAILCMLLFGVLFIVWRRLFSVALTGTKLRGRHYETLQLTELSLEDVTSVSEVETTVGGIKGWSFAASRDTAVFVTEGALESEPISQMIRAYGTAGVFTRDRLN